MFDMKTLEISMSAGNIDRNFSQNMFKKIQNLAQNVNINTVKWRLETSTLLMRLFYKMYPIMQKPITMTDKSQM